MLAAACLALAVALAVASTPWVLYRLRMGRRFPLPGYGAWTVRTFAVVAFGQFVLSAAVGIGWAAWVGASAVLYATLRFGWAAERVHTLQRACKALVDPGAREASAAFIEGELARRKARGARSEAEYQGYARTAIAVAGFIETAGLTPLAVRVLLDVDEAELGPRLAAMRAQSLAVFHLRSGDRPAARAVLARVRRPVKDAELEDALAALDALLVALDGDPRDAEARARPALSRATPPTARASWQAVLAHSLAAQGARDDAMVLLREMRDALGPPVLDRVARHQGAASPLAESLRAETNVPYR